VCKEMTKNENKYPTNQHQNSPLPKPYVKKYIPFVKIYPQTEHFVHINVYGYIR
jgi:hypothetical protein